MNKFLENAKDKLNNLSAGTKTAIVTSSIALGSAMPAFAADATIDPAITSGFTTAGAQVSAIIGLGVAATVGVIALSGGAKAGLKWIKGVFAKAS
ncbi:hypothetical protein GNF86_14910 [Clostridium perfringens]|jgi:Mg/Co/Ni transporter MgtE